MDDVQLKDMLNAMDRDALAEQTAKALASMTLKGGPGEAVAALAVVQADMLGRAIAVLFSTGGVVKPGHEQELVDSLCSLHSAVIRENVRRETFGGVTAGNA